MQCFVLTGLCIGGAGIPELVALLQSQGKSVFLVSGGFRPIINPIADMLNISREHVFANTILFSVRTLNLATHSIKSGEQCILQWIQTYGVHIIVSTTG